MKYVLLALLAYLAWRWVTTLKSADSPAARAPQSAVAEPPQSSDAETMVGCAHCGIHLPQSEAICGEDDALNFCCDDHRLQYVRSRTAA